MENAAKVKTAFMAKKGIDSHGQSRSHVKATTQVGKMWSDHKKSIPAMRGWGGARGNEKRRTLGSTEGGYVRENGERGFWGGGGDKRECGGGKK